MKTYKVLEAHQGDKAYVPGDRRIADPNTVGHLVTLGLLEEIGDAPTEAVARDPLVDAAAQIEALTGERNDARAELGTLRELQRGSEGDLVHARADAEMLRGELRTAHEQAETLHGELRSAHERAEALAEEVAQLKAALPAGDQADPSAGDQTTAPAKPATRRRSGN